MGQLACRMRAGIDSEMAEAEAVAQALQPTDVIIVVLIAVVLLYILPRQACSHAWKRLPSPVLELCLPGPPSSICVCRCSTTTEAPLAAWSPRPRASSIERAPHGAPGTGQQSQAALSGALR